MKYCINDNTKLMTFMKNIMLIMTILMVISTKARAQEPNFSMYHYTPFFTNPGQLGVVEDVRLMLNFRNQSTEAGENFRASAISGYYPIHIGEHQLVIGAGFLNDKAADFVVTNGGLLGLAYSIRMSSNTQLSLGMQGGFFQRSIDADFTTDDQFDNGVFNPNITSGDAVLNQTKSYPTLSGGIYYDVDDNDGREKAFIGVALFNAVEPNVSFVDATDDKFPLSYKATAGYRIFQGQKLSITPTMRWVSQAGNSFANIGSRFGYQLNAADDGVSKIELGTWFNTNDLAVFSLAYETPGVILAASYDLPVSNELNAAKNGIFELGVSLRLKKKSRRVIHETSAVEPVNEEVEEPQEMAEVEAQDIEEPEEEVHEAAEEAEEKTVEPEPEPEDTEELPVQPVAKEAEPLTLEEKQVLAKTVMFELNSDNLDAESKSFLDEVARILSDKAQYNIKLTGHTCNLGEEEINIGLSEDRAKIVARYLVQNGVSSDRIEARGAGESNPVATNDTEAGRRQNRRVEFEVYIE